MSSHYSLGLPFAFLKNDMTSSDPGVWCFWLVYHCRAEVESSRTSLASRTHFEVLGLGLEASSPRKLPCPRLQDSTIFEQLKFCWKTPETSRKICKHLFCFLQLEHRRRQEEGGRPPPNCNFTNNKNVTKKPSVSSVSVSF